MADLGKTLFLAVALPFISWGATDITFFATSDMHYGTNQDQRWIDNRVAMPAQINGLPGQQYPASVGGGPIANPLGILIPGDLVDKSDSIRFWNQYAAAYGVDGEGQVKFPVYDGLGNHDDPGLKPTVFGLYKARNQVRMKSARTKVSNMDSAGYNYSWDWGQVHFVNLNLYSGSVARTRDEIVAGLQSFRSLDFLKVDLAKHVGGSGRPIFIMQHYSFDGSSIGTLDKRPWWLDLDAEATYEVLKDYNVIGLLHGHSHGKKIYKWKGIDVFDDGTTQNGDLFAFRIKETRMFVVNRIGPEWGNLKFEKAITLGTPTATGPGAREARALPGTSLTLSIAGQEAHYGFPAGFERAEVRDLAGKVLVSFPVTSRALYWDRRDSQGGFVPAGVYFMKLSGKKSAKSLKLVLD